MYTQTLKCPQCSKPLVANMEHIFDYNVNPSAINLFFDASINALICDNCGFYGKIAAPLVFHDPDKELLLTYIPSELGIPRDEQEKIIGDLLKVIIDSLPNEKRKGYLLNPQSFFTYDSLVNKISQSYNIDISGEKTEEFNKRLEIIRRIIEAESLDQVDEIIKTEKDQIDEQVIMQFSQILEGLSSKNSPPEVIQSLDLKYNKVLSNTEAGKVLLKQISEIHEVRKMIEEAGDLLTREKLINIAIESSDSEQKINYLVSNTRPLMDYKFFQMLTDKIVSSKGDEQKKLMELRSKLLSETEKIDKEIESFRMQAKENFNKMIQSPNIESIVIQNLPLIDTFFLERLSYELADAKQKGDRLKEEKIKKMQAIIRKLFIPSKAQFLLELLDQSDEQAIKDYLINNHIVVDKAFIEELEKFKNSLPKNTPKETIEQFDMVINVAKAMVK